MPRLGRRIAATLVDILLSLMLTGLLIWPLLSFADPDFWRIYNPVPLMVVLVFVLLSLLTRTRTPGKRWMKLQVFGTGCLPCREMRRSGWALIWGLGEILEGALGHPTSAVAGLIGLGVFAASYGLPVGRQRPDFPHNTAAGFSVSDAQSSLT